MAGPWLDAVVVAWWLERAIVNLILRRTSSPTVASEWLRFNLIYQYLLAGKALSSTQWALEALVDGALPSIPLEERNPNRATSDNGIELIVRSAANCFDSKNEVISAGWSREICAQMPNPRSILQKIIDNKNIGEAVRTAAGSYLK